MVPPVCDPQPTPRRSTRIELIKRYREQYGVSMAEATEAVEAQLMAEAGKQN
ncbi:MAG: hypothetical protein QM778_14865 [Myxococcales bacterium]